jgi:membrane protein implicated in regulation of membrane protease activity
MGKDKAFGFAILLFGLILIVFYIFWGPLSLIYQNSGQTALTGLAGFYSVGFFNWEWAVVIPLTLMVVLVGLLAAWIGYSMITTPPPVPLEELEEELEAEEAANLADEDSQNAE